MTALDHQYISQYIVGRERFTPATAQEDWDTVNRFTCADAVLKKAFENVDRGDPNNYFNRYKNATVQPVIVSINYLKGGGNIYNQVWNENDPYRPEAKETSQVANGELSIRYYSVMFAREIKGLGEDTLNYQTIIGVDYTEKTEQAGKKRLNPFGFCVYSYDTTRMTNYETASQD